MKAKELAEKLLLKPELDVRMHFNIRNKRTDEVELYESDDVHIGYTDDAIIHTEIVVDDCDSVMPTETKEQIARNAANTFCRCFKCDGIIRETNCKCDKEKLTTCLQWYYGYRIAMLALSDERIGK